jgi:hypothetical protein
MTFGIGSGLLFATFNETVNLNIQTRIFGMDVSERLPLVEGVRELPLFLECPCPPSDQINRIAPGTDGLQ